MYTLYGRPGWGSVLVETQLAFYGLPYTFEEVDDLFQSPKARERLAALNPVSQVPTLVLPGGEVMTESAAITLYLADVTESDALVPGPGAAERPAFLRWLVFLVANIYPTFTFADDPRRFVKDKAAQKAFRASVDAYEKGLWKMVADAAAQPWFLGERFSALDIYVAAMTRWRPRRPWFEEHHPRLYAIAERTDQVAELQAVWRRNAAGDEA
jgi:GST-like protein